MKKRPKKKLAPTGRSGDLATWLTREQAAQLAGVSLNTIVNAMKDGRLHEQRAVRPDRRGALRPTVLYDPKEVVALRRAAGFAPLVRTEGEIAAAAFEMFDAGKSHREIVIALREPLARVRALHEDWLDSGGAALVINATGKQLLHGLVGPFDDIAGLIANVTARLPKRR